MLRYSHDIHKWHDVTPDGSQEYSRSPHSYIKNEYTWQAALSSKTQTAIRKSILSTIEILKQEGGVLTVWHTHSLLCSLYEAV